jgi:hypothetical protein
MKARRMRWAGHVAGMEKRENAYRDRMGWDGMDWIDVAQDRDQ